MAFLTLNKSYIAAGESFRLIITDPDGVVGDSLGYTLIGDGLTPAHFEGESSLSGSIIIGANKSGFKDFTTTIDLPTGDEFMVLTVSSPGMNDLYLSIYSDDHYLTPKTKIELGDTFDTWRKKTNGFIARLDVLEDSTSEIKVQTIISDGINSEYTLNFTINSPDPYFFDVNIDGIAQNPGEAYTINEENNSIVFSEIPTEFSSISIIHRFGTTKVARLLPTTTWGSITGQISDSVDLQDALDAKVSDIDLSNIAIGVSDTNGAGTTTEATVTVTAVNGSNAHFHLGSTDSEISVTKGTSEDYSIFLKHNNITRTDTTDSQTGVFSGNVDVITSVTSSLTGHVTGVETTTLTIPDVSSFISRLEALEYVPIDITSFTVAPTTTTYEYALATTYTPVFNWVTSKEPVSLSLSSPFTTPILASNDTSYSEPAFSITNTTGAATTKSWILTASDGSNIDTATKNITWIYPFYYGTDASDLSSGIGIDGLTKSVTTKSNKTFSINAIDQFIYFAYPAVYGNLSSIIDGNGFNVISSFTQYIEDTFTGGNSISYNIYKNNSVTTVNPAQNYQFKF